LIALACTVPSSSADVAPAANWIRVAGGSATGVEVGGIGVVVGGGKVAGRGVVVGGGTVGGTAVVGGGGRGV